MVTDTISDILTRIRNANMVKHQIVQVPLSRMSKSIAQILKEEGFIEDFEVFDTELENRSHLLISLKYKGRLREPVICKMERISKPGLRVYSNAKKMPKILGGFGTAIVSTSRGLMTDHQARKEGVGGELLCYIW